MVLIYISLMTSVVEHFFTCLLAICMSSLEKYLSWCLPIFNWAVWFLDIESCIYILGTDSLLVISFSIIFSHLVGCLFILSMASFVFKFNWVSLAYFAFVSFALGDRSETILLHFMSILSSRNFMISSLTFRFLIHFEFIFVYDVRE